MQVVVWLIMSFVGWCFIFLLTYAVSKKYGEDFDSFPLRVKIEWYFYWILELVIFVGGGIYLFFRG